MCWWGKAANSVSSSLLLARVWLNGKSSLCSIFCPLFKAQWTSLHCQSFLEEHYVVTERAGTKLRMNFSANGTLAAGWIHWMFHQRLLNVGWETYVLVVQNLWFFSEGSFSTSFLKQGCDNGLWAFLIINPRDQSSLLNSETSLWYHFHTSLNFLLEIYQGVF